MNCSKRIIEIINVLLEREAYITASEIADQLGISKRTIFREMVAVEELTDSLGMIMDKKTRLGVKLQATTDQVLKFKHIADACDDHSGLDQEARQNKLIS